MSTKPFVLFEDPATHDALNQLSNVDHLVLYCGAGATIDRTGAAWGELISLLLEKVSHGHIDKSELDAARKAVRSSPGEEGGTIAWAMLAETNDNPTQSLDSGLNSILYDKVGWSQGLLLGNIANLATMARLAGLRVTIVTTNYDVYIEEEVSNHLASLAQLAREMERDNSDVVYRYPVPGLRYRAFRRPKSRGRQDIDRQVRKPLNTDATIELVYIHGRIGRKFNDGGTHIVLTEEDYAVTRENTVSTLIDLLGPTSGLVIIGSSLRDQPLLEALIKAKCSVKFALLKLSTWLESKKMTPASFATPQEARETAMAVLKRRGSGLRDLRIIGTDNHEQISQFIEELRLAIEARAWDERLLPIPELSYGTRLQTWFTRWGEDRKPEDEYEVIADFFEQRRGHNKYFEPETRIEVWARLSSSPDDRRLHLVCCTSGPLLRTYVRRNCSLTDPTVAAARGFNEGRPLELGLEDLGLEPTASRWKRFLTVPIFAGFEIPFGQGYYSAAPVGAVVVASMTSKPRFASLPSQEKGRLINELVDLGISILRGDEDEE